MTILYWMPSASSFLLALAWVKPMISGISTRLGPLLTVIWMIWSSISFSLPAGGSWLMTTPCATVSELCSTITMR